MKNTTCYLCGGKELGKRPGKVRDNPDLEVYECLSCGLVFLSSFGHIHDKFYESSGMHDGEVDIRSWAVETAWDDDRRFEFLKVLMENRSVLDFGCGNGGFLLKARAAASRVAGIELEERLQPYFRERGLTVHASMEDVTDTFDIITLFHVLEHIADPVNTLEKLATRLAPGGSMIVEVPNASDALLTLYENEAFSRFTYWSPHLFLYTGSTLEKVAKKAGLRTNYIKQVQRYPLSNHLHWLSKGKPGGHKTWSFLDSDPLHAAYEKQLASIGCCDTIIASFSLAEK